MKNTIFFSILPIWFENFDRCQTHKYTCVYDKGKNSAAQQLQKECNEILNNCQNQVLQKIS